MTRAGRGPTFGIVAAKLQEAVEDETGPHAVPDQYHRTVPMETRQKKVRQQLTRLLGSVHDHHPCVIYELLPSGSNVSVTRYGAVHIRTDNARELCHILVGGQGDNDLLRPAYPVPHVSTFTHMHLHKSAGFYLVNHHEG